MRATSSVKFELARLLANRGVSPKFAEGGTLLQVFANGIQLASGNEAAQLGGQSAQPVYWGIGK